MQSKYSPYNHIERLIISNAQCAAKNKERFSSVIVAIYDDYHSANWLVMAGRETSLQRELKRSAANRKAQGELVSAFPGTGGHCGTGCERCATDVDNEGD
jgi:hypothetical protein